MTPALVVVSLLAATPSASRLTDLAQGISGLDSSPSAAAVVNGKAVFAAAESSVGRELFVSDGTAVGTQLLVDLNAGTASANPDLFTVVGSRVFFVATGAAGRELYFTDGTAGGTGLMDVRSGTSGSTPSLLTPVGSLLFFAATETATGQELYRLDTSGAGSLTRIELLAGAGGSVLDIAAVGTTVYFSADSSSGIELYRLPAGSDTPVLVLDIGSGSAGSSPRELTAVGTTLYFTASTTGDPAPRLWSTDGTGPGTTPLYASPGGPARTPSQLTEHQGRLYFVASDLSATQLYEVDGAAVSTLSGASNADPNGACCELLTSTPAGLFFVASDGSAGRELHVVDAGGPRRVTDLAPGPRSSAPDGLLWTGSELIFAADDTTHGRRLYRTDGTTSGSVELAATPFDPAGPLDPTGMTLLGTGVLFSASTPATGDEPWFVELASSESSLLAELEPATSTASSSPRFFTAVGSRMVFVADTPELGTELWATDGTAAGTVPITELPGAYSSFPATLVPFRGEAVFIATDPDHGRELWRTDGTAAGTVRVTDINTGPASASPRELVVSGDTLFFAAQRGTQLQLFQLPPGQWAPVQIPVPGPGLTRVVQLTAVGSGLFALAEDSLGLRAFLGTPTMVAPLPGNQRFASVSAVDPVVVGADTVLFVAADELAATDSEPWYATAAGVTRLDVRPGTTGSTPSQLTAVGARAFFAANDGSTGQELYTFDGTNLVRIDVLAGATGSTPNQLIAVGEELYFNANAGSGSELWRVRAGQTSAEQVRDLNPGSASSFPTGLLVLDGRLYFLASDATAQRLWTYEPALDRLTARAELDGAVPSGLGARPVVSATSFLFAGRKDGDLEPWSVARDVTPPIVTPHYEGTTGQNGWFVSDVSVTFEVVEPDAEGLLLVGECAPAVISADTAEQQISCSASSEGGAVTAVATVRRDTVAPTLVCEPTATARSEWGSGVPVTLELTAADATDPAAPSIEVVRSDGQPADAPYVPGVTPVEVFATDAAGNRSAPCSVEVTVERMRSRYGFSCASAGSGQPLLLALGLLALLGLRSRRAAARRAVVVLAVVAGTAASAAPMKLVISRLQAAPGVTEAEAQAVGNALESELSALSFYEVLSANSISSLLGMERQRQLAGCSENDNSCLAEVAGALNAERLVISDLSRVGTTWVVNVSLLDGRKAKLIKRVSRRTNSVTPAPLIEELRSAVYELVNAEPSLAGRPFVLERGFGGLSLGLRGEAELLSPGLAVAPVLMLELSGKTLGGALHVIAQQQPGIRLEARLHPWVFLDRIRPHLALGTTAFFNGLAVRGALGVTVKFNHLQLFADAAYERFVVEFIAPGELLTHAALIGVGVAWAL